MTAQSKSYPVAPNSVYVWRGYKNTRKSYGDFASFLGSIFVPACALLQPTVGLRAYFPTLVPQENKDAVLPDQTALMFWARPESHNLANGTVAVRIYQNLHGDLYDMSRSKTTEVPVFLPASLNDFKIDQPYYLFENEADWMMGDACHLIGTRRANQEPMAFKTSIHAWALQFQANPPTGIDAALVCCTDDYAVAWAHASMPGPAFAICLSSLAALVKVHLQLVPRRSAFGKGLWSKWEGLDYTKKENTSLNVQFERPEQTDPR